MGDINLAAQPEGDRNPFVSRGDQTEILAAGKEKEEDTTVLPYPVIVNGIIWSEKVPVAIINNEIVQENEVWRDFKVERIEKDRVILKRREQRFEIPLVSENENVQKRP